MTRARNEAAILDGGQTIVGAAGLTFTGSTSGTTALQASATASGTLTLPAATDTLVGAATSATLTNKTLNGDILGYPVESIYTTGTGFAGYTYYVQTNGAVQYITASATASGTLNITASASTTLNTFMATGQALTVVLLNTNGTTAYYPTAYQIDGTSVTPKWVSGTAPTAGNASAIDAYTITIIKTASATYTILASQVKYA